MSAYIQQLRRQHASPVVESSKTRTLEARFSAWYNNLPPEGRQRPFTMREIEVAINSQGRHISAVLVQLGWRRQRVWSAQRYCRYWVPPAG